MSDYERLKDLLLGDERAALARQSEAVARIEREQAELPERVPELIAEAARGKGRERLGRALSGPVADALGEAVVTHRQVLVDALFPVIGPAIRKAITEALRGLVADINTALESSFTPRGLAWRIESWRTGAPYPQVVLKHTLKYRIEHLFLIERDSGLVLHRESAPELADLDSDAIAGMLTAIGEFVKDSVGRDPNATLDAARVGEHLLLVVVGPRANLACFVRGVPPAALTAVLQRRLELAHERMAALGTQLQAGAADVGAALDDTLASSGVVAEVRALDAPQAQSSRRPFLIALVALVALLSWLAWREWQWTRELARVREIAAGWPGLYLERVSGHAHERVIVRGLIDPLADPPQGALRSALSPNIELELALRGFVSTEPDMVLRRARAALPLPDGVELAFDAGALTLSGSTSPALAAELVQLARLVPGVASVAHAGLRTIEPPSRAELDAALAALAEREFAFDPGRAEPASDAELEQLASDLRAAAELADKLGFRLVATSYGLTDELGAEDVNAELRDARARWLAGALVAATGFEVSVANLEPAETRATLKRRAARLALRLEPRTEP